MAKRKKKPQEKVPVSPGDVALDILAFVLLLIPVATVLKMAHVFVVFAAPASLPLWASAIIGLMIGAAAVGFIIAISGSDFLDFIVGPGFLLLMIFILLPVAIKAKGNASRHKSQAVPAQIQAPAKTP